MADKKSDPTNTDTQSNAQPANQMDVQTPDSPAPQSTSTPTTDQILTAQQNQQGNLGQPARLDETVPGGKFLVNGQYVNANGEPFKEKQDQGK